MLILLLSACLLQKDEVTTPLDSAAPAVDADADGHPAEDDCDDADPAVHPGATEVCGGGDEDCDGAVDEGLERTWYVDEDRDGFGADPVTACAQPERTAEAGGDCDDADPTIRPGAEELCDGVDQDCDGQVDFTLSALHFNADSDRVTIPDSAALALGGEGTLELRVLLEATDAADGRRSLLSKELSVADVALEDKLFAVHVDAEGALVVAAQVLDVEGQRVELVSERDTPTGAWVHLALSWDATGYALYVEGQPAASGEDALDPADGLGALYLGSAVRGAAPFTTLPSFRGYMSDLRISDVRRYTDPFTPEPELVRDDDTVVLFALRQGAGQTLFDLTGSSAPGQLEGPAWVELGCDGQPVP